jgi:hypothetical protein
MNKYARRLLRVAAQRDYCAHPVYLSQWYVTGHGEIENRPGQFVRLDDKEKEYDEPS